MSSEYDCTEEVEDDFSNPSLQDPFCSTPSPNPQKRQQLSKLAKFEEQLPCTEIFSQFSCSCGRCNSFPESTTLHKEENRKCCQQEKLQPSIYLAKDTCLLDDSSFVAAITNKWTIGFVNEMELDLPAEDAQTALRHGSYRAAVYFLFGRTGRYNRRPLPVCVEAFIKDRFPDPNGIYVGYHE